ncbi:hypothetical protein BN874_3030001 [Candidatus Contendobacter odensis Run_B_J11]|uniref:Uncharacterized protein n=1 Tax=Candidatus Contendobacter odensis Run_B_J11 TaxID=1400861 RepID=A0A7U7GCV7_9GAMM|nr:hypothetical protein BN874_3030001 [Candidatus Contendobacter odensis Run_B_J11]
MVNATFEQKRQRVDLLIDRVIVTDAEVEIRYVIPTHPSSEHIRFCHLRKDYFGGPDRVGSINDEITQQVGENRMHRAPLAGAGLGVQGLDTHFPHQGTNPLASDQRPLFPQHVTEHPYSREGGLQMPFIDSVQEREIRG